MKVDGVSMTLALNHLWKSGELFIFLFRLNGLIESSEGEDCLDFRAI